MENDQEVILFWFRRDLRLEDNTTLNAALNSGIEVQPIFIFDTNIINELPENDARVHFIYTELRNIHNRLTTKGSGVLAFLGDPVEIWTQLSNRNNIKAVYANRDYEPYAVLRDKQVSEILSKNGIEFKTFKDHVIFEPDEILKSDGSPYTVYTNYKNRWLEMFSKTSHQPMIHHSGNYFQTTLNFPAMSVLGLSPSIIKVRPTSLSSLENYSKNRDLPAEDDTSYLGPHLRFGTVSIRKVIHDLKQGDSVFLSELIWREFFQQILYNYPKVVSGNFHSKYDAIQWRNNEDEFERWKNGVTGYPMVDAGMRQLNETGYMHNRVRMVTASFLCKHLLIDWRWGEAYFAQKLLDFELASNNGNWQWAAGTGCDAAPYFRIFNPTIQSEKFDPDKIYIKRWISELDTEGYPAPIVEHKLARERALATYKNGLTGLI